MGGGSLHEFPFMFGIIFFHRFVAHIPLFADLLEVCLEEELHPLPFDFQSHVLTVGEAADPRALGKEHRVGHLFRHLGALGERGLREHEPHHHGIASGRALKHFNYLVGLQRFIADDDRLFFRCGKGRYGYRGYGEGYDRPHDKFLS